MGPGELSSAEARMLSMTLPAGLDRDALDRLLGRQELVVSRLEAAACGMSPGQLRHRIRPGGPWQRLLPGIYLTVTGSPTRRQLEIAALRYAGRDSVITGIAALRRQGVRTPESSIITLLIPRGRARQDRAFVRVWPTTRMPEYRLVDGAVEFTMAARAIADAARELESFRDYRAMLADAVQRRRCKLDVLARELSGAPMRHSGWLRRALAEVADGVRSVAEGDLRTLISGAGLPAPLFNARLYAGRDFLAVADAWWPEAGVAAEVDSREWHLSPGDWERTVRRSRRMSAHGILVLHLTPQQIRTDAATVAEEIRSALHSGRARPALPIRTLAATG